MAISETSRAEPTVGPASHGERPRGRSLLSLVPLLSFMRPYGLQLAGATVALVISSAAVLLLGQGVRRLVDQGLSAANTGLLDRTAAVLMAIVVLLAISTYSRFSLVSWIGERVVADLRIAVFDRIVQLSPAYFETTKTGEILSRLTTDTTLLQTVIGSSVSMALRNALILLGGLVMLVATSAKLAGLVLVVVPLVVVPILFFGRRVRSLSRRSQDRVADVGAYAEEMINAIRTVQAFTHEPIDRARFAQRTMDSFAVAVARIRVRALLTAVVILLAFGAIAFVLWVGGYDVIEGRLSGGDLSAFLFYAVLTAFAVGTISEVFGDLQRAAGAAERLLELLATRPDIAAPAQPARRFTAASRSRTSRSTTLHGRIDRPSPISRWRSSPARRWPWSDPPAPAKRRFSNCCSASTIPPTAVCGSTASTSPRPIPPSCAGVSASSHKTPSSSVRPP
jgi:ATP-binding cassette subfamily B protein